jgi:hypothetical protein
MGGAYGRDGRNCDDIVGIWTLGLNRQLACEREKQRFWPLFLELLQCWYIIYWIIVCHVTLSHDH